MNKELYDKCVELAAAAIAAKGHNLNAESQVQNIFSYMATDADFAVVTNSAVTSPAGVELRAQIKYICELGLDTAKGKKLVYVKTRNCNMGNKAKPNWVKMPDIQESYHALIQLLIKSELVQNINVIHTFQNYKIDYTGVVSDIPTVRAWETSPAERGEYTGCFVVITFKGGEVQTSYHHLKDILDTHKTFSKSGKTWETHQRAMVAKSAILDATRYIPKLDTIVAAVVERYDKDHDWDNAINPNKITEEQRQQLVALMGKHNVDGAEILESFGISSLDDLPKFKFKQCGFEISKRGEINA